MKLNYGLSAFVGLVIADEVVIINTFVEACQGTDQIQDFCAGGWLVRGPATLGLMTLYLS